MTDMERYIREHVESDIALNREFANHDLSQFLCNLLAIYETGLRFGRPNFYDNHNLLRFGIFGLGQLETEVERELGKEIALPESKKVLLAMRELYDKTKFEGLKRIEAYAAELGKRRDLSLPAMEFNNKLLELYKFCTLG